MNSGHYTAASNCSGKTFQCNDNKITECNIMDAYNSSTAYILLYKVIMECQGGNMSRRTFVVAGIVECLQPDRGGWELIPWCRHSCLSLKNGVFGSLISDVTCNYVC